MTRPTPSPDWQLPPGVTTGTMEYAESESIARDYDDYFSYTSLFQFDQSILTKELQPIVPGGFVVDFGCGTGRSLIPLCRQGYHGIAIDLSDTMLDVVAEKSQASGTVIHRIKANLVQLEGLRDNIAEHGICLFSSLGMIQGRKNRSRAVQHFRRMIKPGGKLILHVHNYWYNLYDPGGPWWMMRNAISSLVRSDEERGDRTYPYRGVSNMFLHVFTRRELVRMLKPNGFRRIRWLPLNPTRMLPLSAPWFFSTLRCNGWILVCQ